MDYIVINKNSLELYTRFQMDPSNPPSGKIVPFPDNDFQEAYWYAKQHFSVTNLFRMGLIDSDCMRYRKKFTLPE